MKEFLKRSLKSAAIIVILGAAVAILASINEDMDEETEELEDDFDDEF